MSDSKKLAKAVRLIKALMREAKVTGKGYQSCKRALKVLCK